MEEENGKIINESEGEAVIIESFSQGMKVCIVSHNKTLKEVQSLAHGSFKFLSNTKKETKRGYIR